MKTRISSFDKYPTVQSILHLTLCGYDSRNIVVTHTCHYHMRINITSCNDLIKCAKVAKFVNRSEVHFP
jgi:hypothetical protein